MTDYGAFVDVGAEVDGFLHIVDVPYRARGQPAGQRWDGEKMITYKGWNWRCVVASGYGLLSS